MAIVTESDPRKRECRRTKHIRLAAWCGVSIAVGFIWYLLNTVEIPRTVVDGVSDFEITVLQDGIGALLAAALYAVAVVALLKLGRMLKMRKTIRISFATGQTVAALLMIAGWIILLHISPGGIPRQTSLYLEMLSAITLYLCPSSLMMTDTDPRAPLLEIAPLYVIVALLNGVLYSLVAVAIAKVARSVGESGALTSDS